MLAHSLALLSDAAHMLTDAGSIILALVAMRCLSCSGVRHGLGRVGRRHRGERGRPDEGRAGAGPCPRAVLVAEREGGDPDGLGRVTRGSRRLEVDDYERGRQESRILGQAGRGSAVRVVAP